MHKIQFKQILMLSALILTGCSSSQQVSYDSGGMTHTFVASKDAGKQNFLLPIYPNAKAAGEVKAQSEEEQNSFMLLSSPDPVDKIAAYYKKELAAQGWVISQQQMLPELVNIAAKKDKLDGSIMLSSDGKNKTTINLSVSVEPEGTPEVSTDKFIPDKLNPPTD